MIISFSGDEGSGKSTAAQKMTDKLNIPRFYMGQILRDMAKSKGLTILEYVQSGENDPNVDKEVDDYMLKLSQENKNCVIESRTAFHIIPDSIKIYLKVGSEQGAKRIFKQLQEENTRNEIKNKLTLAEVIKKIKDRRKTDDSRYKKYYGVNIRDEKNYDYVLDTTDLSIDQVFQKIIAFVKYRYKSD